LILEILMTKLARLEFTKL